MSVRFDHGVAERAEDLDHGQDLMRVRHDGGEMCGIDTPSILAAVVQVSTRGDRSNQKLIGNAVSNLRFARCLVELSVPMQFRALPLPAFIGGATPDLLPESLFGRRHRSRIGRPGSLLPPVMKLAETTGIQRSVASPDAASLAVGVGFFMNLAVVPRANAVSNRGVVTSVNRTRLRRLPRTRLGLKHRRPLGFAATDTRPVLATKAVSDHSITTPVFLAVTDRSCHRVPPFVGGIIPQERRV